MMDPVTAARFKDLCLDASTPAVMAGFWSRALELTPDAGSGKGVVRLAPGPGRPRAETLWINPVPEPRSAKTRVHLDLRLALPDPAPLLAAGAGLVRSPGDDPWWVLADPEGNEFCAFPPRAGTPNGVFELVVDCRDPGAQAAWWAGVVGGTVEHEKSWASLTGAAGFPWDHWVFNPVPEPKTVKNRLHWDVDLAAGDPSALVAAGATVLREPGGDIDWWVLADPEDNEFCAFPADDG